MLALQTKSTYMPTCPLEGNALKADCSDECCMRGVFCCCGDCHDCDNEVPEDYLGD